MDPFEVLGVAPSASHDELRAAYRRLVRIHHPDRHAAASPQLRSMHEARMAEVTGAWRLVHNPQALARQRAARRRRSDASGAAARPTTAREPTARAAGGGTTDHDTTTGAGHARPGDAHTGPGAPGPATTFDYRRAAATEFTTSSAWSGRRGQGADDDAGARPRPVRTTILLLVAVVAVLLAVTDTGQDVLRAVGATVESAISNVVGTSATNHAVTLQSVTLPSSPGGP